MDSFSRKPSDSSADEPVNAGSVTNPLMPISKTVVKANQPLPCAVYRANGELLAAKDKILTEDQAFKLVQMDTIYTLKSDLVKLVHRRFGRAGQEQSYRAKSPFTILDQLESDLEDVFENYDDPLTLSNLTSAAGRVQTICKRWPDAALAKIFFDDKAKYTVQHSIHAAILCELVTQHLSWPDAQRKSLIGAALSMNISLGFLQDEWQEHKGQLDDAQRRLLHEHPQKSAHMLREIGITDNAWLDIVLTHHERADGSGYPKGLSGKQLPDGSQILQIADMYGAKISGRKYRDAYDPTEAARYFYSIKEETHLNDLVEVFVKAVGIYPPGSIVELNSGEIAVVVRRGIQIHQPFVKAITDRSGRRVGTPMTRSTDNKTYAIKQFSRLPLNFGGYNFESLWGFR